MVLQSHLFFADIYLFDIVDEFLFETVGVIGIFSDLVIEQFPGLRGSWFAARVRAGLRLPGGGGYFRSGAAGLLRGRRLH